jgi:hypothetical protein
MGASIFFTAAMTRTFRSARTRDQDDLKARIIAAVKNIDAPMLKRVWQELEYGMAVCRVTRGARIEHSSCQKTFFSFPVAVNSSITVGPLVFLL